MLALEWQSVSDIIESTENGQAKEGREIERRQNRKKVREDTAG